MAPSAPAPDERVRSPEERACRVFCRGGLLERMQAASVFGSDSKTMVDSPLLEDPEVLERAFAALGSHPTREELEDFKTEFFGNVGADLKAWVPPDWTPGPEHLAGLAHNSTLREFAVALHSLWRELGREPADGVHANPQRNSLLRSGPTIVPGGRFRESYYWDSYWIVRGILISGMDATATRVVDNLLEHIRRFGFVPNGGRVYYLNRSQPPMLSEMVVQIAKRTDATNEWLADALSLLEREHEWWSDRRGLPVTRRGRPGGADSDDDDGSAGATGDRATSGSLPLSCDIAEVWSTLNRYDANTTLPRPESWREDAELARQAGNGGGGELMRNIAAGAESGWDFSSRWFKDHRELRTSITTHIVPVELNVILTRMEANICLLRRRLNDAGIPSTCDAGDEKNYCAMAARRSRVIESCMWDESRWRWNDLVLPLDAPGSLVQNVNGEDANVANYLPLWMYAGIREMQPSLGSSGPAANGTRASQAARSLRDSSGLFRRAGLATTNVLPRTGQQWDYPNAWPPLNQMIIEGLDGSAGLPDVTADDAGLLRAFSDDLSTRFLDTMLLAWQRSGYVYEKYDATRPGFGGGGGEYLPQIGFGWSIGVAQILLEDRIGRGAGDDGGSHGSHLPILMGCIGLLSLLLLLVLQVRHTESGGWRLRYSKI